MGDLLFLGCFYMQSINWYVERLKSMSQEEIVWRAKSLARDHFDKVRFAIEWLPAADKTGCYGAGLSNMGFSVSNVRLGAWEDAEIDGLTREWRQKLVVKADDLMKHNFTFFDLNNKFLGHPIDWNRDHGADKPTPQRLAQTVNYRDFENSGDCKLVWEPNRHHQLVVLGRAYRATGNERYAAEVVSQIESWMEQNKAGYGMNWRSPLELGIRLINWVWAVDMIRDSGKLSEEFVGQFKRNVYLHCWDVARKFSKGSSANNHLVGEAAGVYIASSYFTDMDAAKRWRVESKNILIEEIQSQTYPDGLNREHALGYQFFVLQFYIFSGLVGRWTNDDFPASYWQQIKAMVESVMALSLGGESLPMFGDRDDGYVLDLGSEPEDIDAILSVGALLFNDAGMKSNVNRFSETGYWLFGNNAWQQFDAIEISDTSDRLASCAFIDSGYYLLQTGSVGKSNCVSVLLDCAELGYGAIAAHGHADALSFSLRVGRKDILVDPGTYDYFTYPEWRKYFRTTSAHNTVSIDGLDQSEMLGPFMWGKRANTTLESWETLDDMTLAVASHDGYTRLPDPVTHRRNLKLNNNDNCLTIKDDLLTISGHTAKLYFHFSEFCDVKQLSGNLFGINVDGLDELINFQLDDRLSVEILKGSDDPKCGWVSRGYHQKVPTVTLVATKKFTGNVSFTTTINCGIK